MESLQKGRSEILAEFSCTTTGKLAPMFVIRDSQGFTVFIEICFNGDPFQVLVRETRAGTTRDSRPETGHTVLDSGPGV